MRLLHIMTIAGAMLALPFTSAAQSRTVTLDPGLYDYSHVVSVNGQVTHMDDYEYCLVEGRNSKTMDEIVADIIEGGQCTASGVVMTMSTGRANVSCIDPDYGIRSQGQMEANYGPDFYNVDTEGRINGMPINVKTRVKRRSACPAGWNNPDNVSPD